MYIKFKCKRCLLKSVSCRRKVFTSSFSTGIVSAVEYVIGGGGNGGNPECGGGGANCC